MGNPADRDGEFEPSYLVRTPSGNVYIPTGKFLATYDIIVNKCFFLYIY